jgi:hypothetical protein
MSSFLNENLGAAESGVFWDAGNFKLWQSARPGVVLFIAKQPGLAVGANGRYELAVSSYSQQQTDRSYKITGGSAMFTITSAIQYDLKQFQQVQDSWRAAIGPNGRNVQFMPLNVQKGECTVLINPMSGTPDKAHNDKDVGTPGGTNSFLVELTELGAQEWVQGIKNKTAIPAGVKFMYEYLRMMPEVGATVTVWGRRVFTHLSTALDVSVDGFWYGGSAKIDAAWEDMVRNGDVTIEFFGTPPPDFAQMEKDLITTFANQAKEMLFNQIFAPKPDVKPAQAGNTSGVFGGANFALKWKKETDSIDLKQTIKFKGWTWLKASMDADLSTLFAKVDPSYVTEVQTQQAFPASIVVDSDEMLSDVAVSMSFSQGHSPEAPVFAKIGGNERYVVVSQNPDEVQIRYNAKINYAAPRWPLINVSDSKTVKLGGNQIVIKPGQWIGRHQIFMFVRDGNNIVPVTELTDADYLVLNVSYSGPHLSAPIKDSAHLSGLEMIEFSYPLDTTGRPGVAKFNAFGVIGGKLVRAGDQVISPDETAVFVLASKDGRIQLVSKDSVIGESDSLAQDLLAAAARPMVTGPGAAGAVPEAVKAVANGAGIEGTTVGVEYDQTGSALWINEDKGGIIRVLLHSVDEANPFSNTKHHVKVKLDPTGKYADSIVVDLK